jgi:hypothetical protein
MKNSDPSQITWSQIKNWWPLLIAAITISATLGGVFVRLGNVENELKEIKASQAAMYNDFKLWRDQLEARVGGHDLSINTLKINQNTVLKKLGL